VVPEIAKRGCIAFLPGEEMLVYTQYPRTGLVAALRELVPKKLMEPALDRSGADLLALGETLLTDPVKMLPEHLPAKEFRAPTSGRNRRKALIEVTPAAQTMKLERLKVKLTLPTPPAFMAKLAHKGIFLAKLHAATARARYRSGIPDLYPHHVHIPTDILDLIAFQSQYLCIVGHLFLLVLCVAQHNHDNLEIGELPHFMMKSPVLPVLQQTERIVFLGDSITAAGARPDDYITLIRQALDAFEGGAGIETIGAGISGNKVNNLQARLQKDVLDREPTIVFIYIGINDVWHWKRNQAGVLAGGTTEEAFEAGLKEIIGRITAAGARVFLCTPTVIGEKVEGGNDRDPMLDAYSDISRRVAAETKSQLVDLRAAFIAYLQANNPENKDRGILTRDAVHLNPAGNRLVAAEMLKALGVAPLPQPGN
jgi:lysophospholipase L1-like esterase